MRLVEIYTDRYFETWPSWQQIYEWEDILALQLDLKLIDTRLTSVLSKLADRFLNALSKRLKLKDNLLLKKVDVFKNNNKALYFEMCPKGAHYRSTTSKKAIPCIIDFWETQDLDEFYRTYADTDLVLISSKQVYNHLKAKKCPFIIRHFPLSISDKYRIDLVAPVIEKKYEIIFAGRISPLLKKYFNAYLEKYPETEWLGAEFIDNQIYFSSNKKGMLGNFQRREDYMNLLKEVKVAFYSTPAADDQDRGEFGSFSQVTPRLFEFCAAGCAVIAHYPQNPDTDYYRLAKYFPSVNDYNTFEKRLQQALSASVQSVLQHNARFLENHYTSKRAQLLSQILIDI